MEQFFSYESAKQTLVLSAYFALLIFDVWWITYLFVSIIGWIGKKLKKLFKRKKDKQTLSENEKM